MNTPDNSTADLQTFLERANAIGAASAYGQFIGREDWGKKMTHYIPSHMHMAVALWVLFANRDCGSFFNAVIDNDLFGAMAKADDWNLAALPDYGKFFHNYAPSGCFGKKAATWRGIYPAEI